MNLLTSPQAVLTGNDTLPNGDHRTGERVFSGAVCTWIIIAICCAVFLFQVMLGLPDGRHPISGASFVFHQLFTLSYQRLHQGFIWQPVTHIFLHGTWMHLIFNMLALGSIGPWVERLVGRLHFLAIFLLGGIAGGLAEITFSHGSVLGASGGICALVLALVAYQPKARLWLLLFFVIPIRMRASTLGWGMILGFLFMIVIGHIPFLRSFSAPEIGHMAHLGGSLFGLAYVRLFVRRAEDEPFDPPIFPGEERPMRGFRPRLTVDREQGIRQERPLPPLAPFQPANPPPASAAKPRPPRRNVDPVYEALLDKLEREGLESLTAAELRDLERGARR